MAMMGLLQPVWRLPMVAPHRIDEAAFARYSQYLRLARMIQQTNRSNVFDNKPATYTEDHFRLFHDFKSALNAGAIRAAEPDASRRAAGA